MTDLSRRHFTLGLFAGAAVLACRPSDKGDDSTDSDTDLDSDAESDTESDGLPDTGTSAWATGGTAALAASYADPFTAADDVCALTCSMTLGPCYAETVERKDISEGYSGLPVRLVLRIVDEDCEPVTDATVDIWHTSLHGLYSGDDAARMCTTGDEDAESHRFFRGIQPVDGTGRATFDTCYPGWYSGRAVHIHFTVRRGTTAYVTSQLFFPADLTATLFDEHPEYEGFGQPDTTNSTDNILSGADAAAYTLSTRRADDGCLIAWKTIVVRSDTSTRLCNA